MTRTKKAVDYALNQRDALAVVLTDGRLEISNNRAERAIKELVVVRKNWLFSTSFKGPRQVVLLSGLCAQPKLTDWIRAFIEDPI